MIGAILIVIIEAFVIYRCLRAAQKSPDLAGAMIAATGNVATEDVVFMLNGMGIETGIDLDRLAAAGWRVLRHIGREPQARVSRALWQKMQKSPA